MDNPIIDPVDAAGKYVEAVREEVESLGLKINILGLIASSDKPSVAYAKATQRSFSSVGIHYDLRYVERLDLEKSIHEANADERIHGIFIYFPVFYTGHDDYLRNQVDYRKDIEAGSIYWTRKLYANDRFALDKEDPRKALLPCTPLAIIKILTEAGKYGQGLSQPLEGKIVTIFNRSEVTGRPLAMMLSNDGARVYSFDINGPLLFRNAVPSETDISRREALRQSDIVVTGVPSADFPKIQRDEVRPNVVCINFSSVNNFSDNMAEHTSVYIPRIGPMTVAMCMRNSLRLYHNFHG